MMHSRYGTWYMILPHTAKLYTRCRSTTYIEVRTLQGVHSFALGGATTNGRYIKYVNPRNASNRTASYLVHMLARLIPGTGAAVRVGVDFTVLVAHKKTDIKHGNHQMMKVFGGVG